MTDSLLSLTVGVIGLMLALSLPNLGMILALVTLYFPLLPNVSVGQLEFSMPTFILVGLFLRALDLRHTQEPLRLEGWQRGLLVALGFAFSLSYLFSESPNSSLYMLPNLATYLMWLYVMMKLVRSEQQLWDLARLILVLGFIFSIWRIELRPIRVILGFPSMGINGAVFAFHPAIAVSLVTATMLSAGKAVSLRWKAFAWVTLFSTIYHGFLLETRAAWLAWMGMAAVIGLQAHSRARIVLILGITALAGMAFLFFGTRIEANLNQTQQSLKVDTNEQGNYYNNINPDDLIRLVAREAGLRMFRERPILGWGPNAYIRLKPLFVNYSGKAADLPGAFNAWLIALAEWGLVGTAVALVVFLLPLLQSWRYMRFNTLTTRLAFALALGVLGLSIHLLFIDLMYSFAWAHAGLALAAARVALAEGQGGRNA